MLSYPIYLFYLLFCICEPINDDLNNLESSSYSTQPINDGINLIIDEFTFYDLLNYDRIDYDFIQSITTNKFDEPNLTYTKPEFARFYLIEDRLPINETLFAYLIFIKFPLNSKDYRTYNRAFLILVDSEGYFVNQKIIYQDYDLTGAFIGLNSRIIENRIQMINASTNTLSYFEIDNEGFFNKINTFYNLELADNKSAIKKLTSEVLTKSDLNISPAVFFEKSQSKLSTLEVYRNEDLNFLESNVIGYKEYDFYKSFFMVNKLKSLQHCVYELVEVKYLISNNNWIGTKTLEYFDCDEEFQFLLPS